jgi:hypothetical protein
MHRLKNLRFLGIILICLGVVAGNAYSLATGARPFTKGNAEFRVNHYIGDSSWVENAPLILSNYFKAVHLIDVKNDLTVPKGVVNAQVQSFGVQAEIVQIFNHASADFSKYPLDYRNVYFAAPNNKIKVITTTGLRPYLQDSPSGETYMNVHCAPLVEHNCMLGLYWDTKTTHRSDKVTFVAVRVQRHFFALIEQNLLNKLTEAAPHA